MNEWHDPLFFFLFLSPASVDIAIAFFSIGEHSFAQVQQYVYALQTDDLCCVVEFMP